MPLLRVVCAAFLLTIFKFLTSINICWKLSTLHSLSEIKGCLIVKTDIYWNSFLTTLLYATFLRYDADEGKTNLALSLIVFTAVVMVCMWDGHTESLMDTGHTKHRSSVTEGWPPINNNCNCSIGCSTTLYQPRPAFEQYYKPINSLL